MMKLRPFIFAQQTSNRRNDMFSYLPFPYFIILTFILLVMCFYNAFKFRNSEKSFIFVPLCISGFGCLIAIAGKCINHWLSGTPVQSVSDIIQYINPLVVIGAFIITGMKEYRKGHVKGKNKILFISGICGLITGFMLLIVVLILK